MKGWARGEGSHYYHYFDDPGSDKVSLCGRVYKGGKMGSGQLPRRPNDCHECWVKVAKLGYLTGAAKRILEDQ